ncbi:MAG: glycosyltransferase family 4 protein [Candidatus Aenigmarchaeota archaeon]|nr:glycosyltransferase family 4 protein [Candidatus Aenigmarchaeota archaeon]
MQSVLILATQFKPNIGGIQTYLDDFTKFLLKSEYSFKVLTFKPNHISRLFKTEAGTHKYTDNPKIDITRIGFFDFGITTLFPIRTVIEFFLISNLLLYSLWFMIRNYKKYKIIHANDYVTAAVAFVLSRIFGKKWAMSHHSIFPYFKKSLRREIGGAILNHADVIFANSETVKKQLELGLGKNRPPVIVAHYWIDYNFFRPKDKIEARKALGLPTNTFIVMFLGRLEIAKGVGEFIKASKMTGKDTLFAITGPGEEHNLVRQSVWERLKYIGIKKGEDLIDCYNAADVCCFPTVAIEAFGRVTIEALACGTPVIVSTTATRELIDDSVGLRTKPIAESISKSIITFREKFGNRDMTKICRNFVMKNYNEDNASVIIREYERLMEG